MYERVLLASDGTQEGLTALREGALLARDWRARVFLLVVTLNTPGARLADSVHPIPRGEEERALLTRGLARLGEMGVQATGAVASGEPAMEIGAHARSFKADLVVVGHRRQGLMERWWSGASGAYLVDHVPCSVLIARRIVSDQEFERRLKLPADA
jgi:nucleotide-binding universal stress UspA family protein